MLIKIKSIISQFDLLGPIPQLLIFSQKRYQSFLSSFISIVFIIFSLFFAIFSIRDYLKFDNPNISYSKANDAETMRKIDIKDTPLMFQLIDSTTYLGIDSSIAYYEGYFEIIYDNETIINENLEIEKCELGKNIDMKYKNYVEEKKKFGRKIEEIYCIGYKHNNLSLFYQPNIGYSSLNIFIVIKNHSYYTPEKIQSILVCENSFIDHSNKNNPINKNYLYEVTKNYNSFEYSTTDFNVQYVKYESDDGLFFKSNKLFNGISFSDATYYKNINENYNLKEDLIKYNKSTIGVIKFLLNKSYYNNYKRVYPRVQSFLADVMSDISLIFEIGTQISNILIRKSMSKDIIGNLINEEEKDVSEERRIKIDKLFKCPF